MSCPLCAEAGGEVLWQDDFCRVVRVDDADLPGFCRVIVHRHVAEMSDLPTAEARRLLDVLLATETAVRQVLRPDKVNLASLGNMVPHLHWHVIPRWRGDRYFPGAVWGTPQREADHPPAPPDLTTVLGAALRRVLGGCNRQQ